MSEDEAGSKPHGKADENKLCADVNGADRLSAVAKQLLGPDQEAVNEVLTRLYEAAKVEAGKVLLPYRDVHTLHPTRLVHDSYERLLRQYTLDVTDDKEFLKQISTQMRFVVLDYLKSKAKRDKKKQQSLGEVDVPADMPDRSRLEFVCVAVDVLKRNHAVAGQVVELQYFLGLTVEETANVLGISKSTVLRKWGFAKSWLKAFVAKGGEDGK